MATLDIYAREDLFGRAARLTPRFLDRMFSLADIPVITDIRGYGMLAAFDLAPGPTPGARGYAALKRLFEAGLLIKWTGDTGIVAPALCLGQRPRRDRGQAPRRSYDDLSYRTLTRRLCG